MKLTRDQILAEMGVVPRWCLRSGPSGSAREEAAGCESVREPPDAGEVKDGVPLEALSGREIETLDWNDLEARIAGCRMCPLCAHRRQAVPGVGDRQADWLFIGEGPGADEDAQGEPFVGQAGKLLDNMLASLGLRRGEKVYIANAVKCRPPGNRTPEPEEIAICRSFLLRQIELISPKLIVLLGRTAVHSVLPEEHGSMGSMRGKRFEYHGIPVAVTYHPAYLLRNLPEKAKAWEDLLFARRLMAQGKEEKLF